MSLLDFRLRHPNGVMSARDMRERRERVFNYDFSPDKPGVPPPIQINPPKDKPMSAYDDHNNAATIALTAILIILGVIIIFGGLFFGVPKWNVWRAELQGKAEFARAEQNRLIKIEEAKANLEAEKLNAEAEVERAKGAAKAIEIENGKLTETYIRYLWVRQQSDLGEKTVIYIPTEAGLPVLEAGRTLKEEK